MVREPTTIRSRDRLTSGRTTQTGCYCEDDDVSSGRRISQRRTPRNLTISSGRKRIRRKVDSSVSDEIQGSNRPVAPFSPPSPTLSAETQSVIDNAEKMLREAHEQIMQLSRTPPTVKIIAMEYPDGPIVDNEKDELLYIRELVASRFNELSMGVRKPYSGQQSRPRDMPGPFSKVDLSAPKFRPRTYQEFPCSFTHCHVQKPTCLEMAPVRSPILDADSKRILEKTRSFSIQACPKVNIDRELSAQKMEDVHIPPNPSFVGTTNIGTYEYRHGSCEGKVEGVRSASFEKKRCTKVCRMGEESSTNAVGVQVGYSSVLRESNERARVEDEDVTGVRILARTCQVTNGEQESAASNLIRESIENCEDEGGEERTGSIKKDEGGKEQRELTSKEKLGERRELMGKNREEAERTVLLGELAGMRVNEKDKFKSASEGCAMCLARPDNDCRAEEKENGESKKDDYIRQIFEDPILYEEPTKLESHLKSIPEDRKLERERRAKIDLHFRDILKKYDPRYKSDSSSSFDESLNVDSMSNSQILEYDLDEISLNRPRTKHFDTILSIYDRTIDKITRDSEKIAEKLSSWQQTCWSGSENDNSVENRGNFRSTKVASLESIRKVTSQELARVNDTGDGRESTPKMPELHSRSHKSVEYNYHLYNLNETVNSEASKITGPNMTNAFIDYVPPISGNRNDRNTIANETLVKRENSRGDGESVRATPSIPLNRTSDDEKCLSADARLSNTNEELSVSTEQCAVESKSGKYFATTDNLRVSGTPGASLSKAQSVECGSEEAPPADHSRLPKGKRSPLETKAERELQFGSGDNSRATVVINETDKRKLEESGCYEALRAENANGRIFPNLQTPSTVTISATENAKSMRTLIETNREMNRDVEQSALSTPSRTTHPSNVVSMRKPNGEDKSESICVCTVSKNDRCAHSINSHKSKDVAKSSQDKSKDGERSILSNSSRTEFFPDKIARTKSSQALSAESKVFLTEILSSADSLKDCPSLHTSISCPRSHESLMSDAADNGIVENLIENKTQMTKSIQTDVVHMLAEAKPVQTNVKCVGTETKQTETEGKLVQTDLQEAIVESFFPKRADIDVESCRRFLSASHEKDNRSKWSRGSQNGSMELDTSKATSHSLPHSDYKVRDTASDTSRSEGELCMATSSSYSLGEVRVIGKDIFIENGLTIERDDSEGLITAKSTNSMNHSKFSAESYGEIQ